MNPIKQRLLAAALAVSLLAPALAAIAQDLVKAQQYIIMLRVTPQFQEQSKWTAKENAAVSKHFERLKQATAEGKVIHAGRTTESLDKIFGLVIFEAENEAAAKAFMEDDPAVKAGVMSATLHPYTVVFQR
ncbi:MAG: YciI family protein [Massilia sp.]